MAASSGAGSSTALPRAAAAGGFSGGVGGGEDGVEELSRDRLLQLHKWSKQMLSRLRRWASLWVCMAVLKAKQCFPHLVFIELCRTWGARSIGMPGVVTCQSDPSARGIRCLPGAGQNHSRIRHSGLRGVRGVVLTVACGSSCPWRPLLGAPLLQRKVCGLQSLHERGLRQPRCPWQLWPRPRLLVCPRRRSWC